MTLVRPTLSALIERARSDVETRLPGADSRLRHSVLDVLVRMHGGAMAGLYGYIANVADQIIIDTADGEFLARHASTWGVRRKAAVAARALATATGTNGSVIPAASELTRSDGTIYVTSLAVTISGGTAEISVEASEAGAGGDIAPGALLTFSSAVAGVNATVTVTETSTAGAAEEDDESLRARLLSRIRTPPEGGAIGDYVAWALAQSGVTRAWCYPGWLGAGTVGLTFVMQGRDNPIPLTADVNAMQAALDMLRPVTADLTVFAPSTVAVPFSITSAPSTAEVREAIVAELDDFFRREAEPGGTLYLSRMREAISLSEGEYSHELTVPSANFTADPGVLPIRGAVTFL